MTTSRLNGAADKQRPGLIASAAEKGSSSKSAPRMEAVSYQVTVSEINGSGSARAVRVV